MTAENPLPPVFFNHLYVVLDDKTYRAVQGSDFLRIAFPGTEHRSTLTAAGETWSGTYFYCQDNYLEFFGSGNNPVAGMATRGGHWQPGAQSGWAGLAFSVDQTGGVDRVRQLLREQFSYEPFCELRQLQTRDRLVDWFYSLKLDERLGLGSFDSWLMEYHADIFAHKAIPLPPGGELSRLAYLSPWNKPRRAAATPEEPKPAAPAQARPDPAVRSAGAPTPATNRGSSARGADTHGADSRVPGTPAAPVFTRVTGATIHMDARRAERYAEILTLLGYTRAEDSDAISLAAHGFTLEIRPEEAAPSGYRLAALRLAMARRSVAPMTFVFAPGSELTLRDDMTAVWSFGISGR